MSQGRRRKTAWYTSCRLMQEAWKTSTETLPEDARGAGTTWVEQRGGRVERGPFPICLPASFADRNLVPAVRADALRRFDRHGIEWHGWTPGPEEQCWPSTHLLDSQAQCVNVLLTLAAKPELLLNVVRRVAPDATDLVDVEDAGPLAFEWIGGEDYLGEARGRPRYRGRFSTSADALLVVRRRAGGRTCVLVEWKFTESYDVPVRFRGAGRTDRREVYRPHYEADGSPFVFRPPIDAFFHEPHYQLLRQALLASKMVGASEFGADQALLLHVVPAGNKDLRTTVPDGLAEHGEEIDDVWNRLLPGPVVRYACLESEGLLTATPELAERYGSCCG